jgi:hypothetical protein
MNTRRAANHARSIARSTTPARDDTLRHRTAETHEQMRGRRIPHREPEHHEEGGNYAHEAHASFGSPASQGASKGPGPLPGAGEMPGRGPGAAAESYAGRGIGDVDNAKTPTGEAPKGMKTYNQE